MSIAQGPYTPRRPRRGGPAELPARLRALWQRLTGRSTSYAPQGGNIALAAERPARRPGNSALVEEPSGWLGALCRWSSALAPLGAGLLLFFLAFQLAQRTWQDHPVIAPGTLIPLAAVYVVGGLLFGLALSTAPTLAAWMALLIAGLALYPLVTAAFVLGWTGTLVLAIFMGAAALLYGRRRMLSTPDHHVQITRLGRTYLRTLQPGTTIALPGERVLASLETVERSFDLAPRQMRVESAEGIVYVARAEAEVSYHLVPGQAHKALLASAKWEEDVRNQAARMLDDALADWAVQMLDDEEPPEGLFIARTMLRRLREHLRPWGVHVEAVTVRHIRLSPESDTIPTDWAAGRQRRPVSTPPTAAPRERAEPPPRAAQPNLADARPPAPPPPIAQASPPPLPEDLSPEALSELYEAVRVGRITDPATIRSIAHAFLTVAADQALSDAFPYDAVAAARILLDLAAGIDGQATQAGSGAR